MRGPWPRERYLIGHALLACRYSSVARWVMSCTVGTRCLKDRSIPNSMNSCTHIPVDCPLRCLKIRSIPFQRPARKSWRYVQNCRQIAAEGTAITQGFSDEEAVESTGQRVAVLVSLRSTDNCEQRSQPNQNKSLAIIPCLDRTAPGTQSFVCEKRTTFLTRWVHWRKKNEKPRNYFVHHMS